MITRVFIQKKNGEFVSPNSYAAWRGFTERGFETQFFEWPQLRDGGIPIEPSSLIVGGSGTVRHALTKMGIPNPCFDDLPEALAEFRGRKIWHSTWGGICNQYQERGPEVFVKPLRDPKAFTARRISSFRDLIASANTPDEMPVLVSEPVDFQSEWRFYILRGQIVGTGWYSGHPMIFPDPKVVDRAVKAWTDAPAGYGIDFGVVADGRTLLVEVNEGYSLGCLGLRGVLYSQILEARWTELMGMTLAG